MYSMKRIVITVLFGWLLSFVSIAQRINIGVLDFQQPSLEEYQKAPKGFLGIETGFGGLSPAETRRNRDRQTLDQARAYVVEELGKDHRFLMVERKNLNLILNEKELQKSEDFLDGYVVEQGKSIGADYLVSGMMLFGKKKISLSIFSVKDRVTVASAVVSAKSNILTGGKLKSEVVEAVQEMKAKVFPRLIQVVRPLKAGKTVKKLLIAAGLNSNLKEKQSLSIYYFKEEEFNGEKLTREVTIGKGKIVEVEGENFSILSVKKGGSEIKELMDKGETLYCRI